MSRWAHRLVAEVEAPSESGPRRVPLALVTASELTWRSAVVAGGVVAVAWLFLSLRLVTIPAFVALLATTVLHPAVDALRRRRWPDLAATWAVLLVAVGLVAGTVALLVPALAAQADDLDEQLEGGIAEVERWLETGPLELADVDLQRSFDSALGRAADSERLIEGITLAGELIAGVLLALVMTFFFVKDGPRITGWVRSLLPSGRRDDAASVGRAAWDALGAYVRGTAIVGIVNGVIIGTGLAIIGVPLAVPLGLITAISAFFPLVGAVAAGAVAALVALFAGGVSEALIVVGLVVVVQQVEGDVLSPLVMGRALRLHPLVILVALTVGAISAGLLGAFLAVPLTGVAVAAVAATRNPEHS